MSRIVSYTCEQIAANVWVYEYVTDDFCRLVHDTRTGEWTLHRIPNPTQLMEVVVGRTLDAEDIAAFTAPIRYVPPVQAGVAEVR